MAEPTKTGGTSGLITTKNGKKVIGCWGECSRLVIPEGVSEIADGAFRDKPVYEVELPSTLITIGDEAFAGTKIERVHIPASVTSIGPDAFMRTEGEFARQMHQADIPTWFDVDEANEAYESWDGSLVRRIPDGYELVSLYYEPPMVNIPEGITRLATHSVAAHDNDVGLRIHLPDSLINIQRSAIPNANVRELHVGPNLVYADHDFWRYAAEDLPFIYDPASGEPLRHFRVPEWRHVTIDSRNPRYSITGDVLRIKYLSTVKSEQHARDSSAAAASLPDFPLPLVIDVGGLDGLSEYEKRAVERLKPGSQLGLSVVDSTTLTGKKAKENSPAVVLSFDGLADMGYLDPPKARAAAGADAKTPIASIAACADALVARVRSVTKRADSPDGKVALVVELVAKDGE